MTLALNFLNAPLVRFTHKIQNNQKFIKKSYQQLNRAERDIIQQYLRMDRRDLGKLLRCLDRI